MLKVRNEEIDHLASWRSVVLRWWIAGWAAIVLLITLLWPKDTTDPEGFGRSGMVPRIDNATGCHYLTRWWGITPRLRADGTPGYGCSELPTTTTGDEAMNSQTKNQHQRAQREDALAARKLEEIEAFDELEIDLDTILDLIANAEDPSDTPGDTDEARPTS